MNHENARFYALTRYAGEIIVRVRITNNAKNSVFLYEVTKKKKKTTTLIIINNNNRQLIGRVLRGIYSFTGFTKQHPSYCQVLFGEKRLGFTGAKRAMVKNKKKK